MRMRSPRTVQQMQPLFISKISSSVSTTRSLSMPTSPNSFSITAMRLPCRSVRMRFKRVVLPAPRYPVRMVTGTRGGAAERSVGASMRRRSGSGVDHRLDHLELPRAGGDVGGGRGRIGGGEEGPRDPHLERDAVDVAEEDRALEVERDLRPVRLPRDLHRELVEPVERAGGPGADLGQRGLGAL